MPQTIEKAWITPYTSDLVTLSFSSLRVVPEWARIQVNEVVFPDRDTKAPRHTVSIKLLDDDDLVLLRDAIDEYLHKERP